MTTGFLHHPDCIEHDPGKGHPERPARLRAILARLEESGLLQELDRRQAREATDAELETVHPAEHVEAVRAACTAAPSQLDADTHVSTSSSWPAALRASGALLEAVERVVDGTWRNAFCAVRPPGHHAEVRRAMGFCLFNNVALGARALRTVHGLERVAVVDFDVHHGNGTQHVFEDDPTVFYASLHQWPLYPGTGTEAERGRGEGEGATLNVPRSPGARDADWLSAFENRVLPALDEFRPEFVLVSAGFDAHRSDPLAQTRLTEEGYREMTRGLLGVAERHAGGRLVSVLEGGYHLEALASCVEVHVGELAGSAG